MTNLEFYKNEIKKQYEEYKKYSNNNTFTQDLADVLFAIWEKHRTTRGDLLDWLCEEHQILDKEEKEYLSAVIKPFAYRTISITKIKDWIDEDSNFEVLKIALMLPCENRDMEFVHLPYFEKDTMYKGMELDKEYTLKELGL